MTAAILPPLTSQIAYYTPQQVQWMTSLATHANGILVARFRPELGSRPTIYLRDASLASSRRVDASLRYFDMLLSNLLKYYCCDCQSFSPAKTEQLYCILQMNDEAIDFDLGMGYCSNGPLLTLIPDVQFWMYNGYIGQRQEFIKAWVPWEGRVPQIFWRGSSTGAHAITLASLPQLPRFRLCDIAASNKVLRGALDARLTNVVQAGNVDQAEQIRTYLASRDLLSAHVPQLEFLKYRFQIDIDGNSNAWSFLLKLLMGSCVLKVRSSWRQWYYSEICPWKHYVPVKNDLSDLEQQATWCLDHDEEAREIAVNGMRFARGIVFGPEMRRAAGLILQASRNCAGSIF